MKKFITVLVALTLMAGASLAIDRDFNRSTGYSASGGLPYTNGQIYRESLTMSDSGNGATPFTFRVDKTSMFVRSGASAGAQWTQGDLLTFDTAAVNSDTGFLRLRRINLLTDSPGNANALFRPLVAIARNLCDTGNSCFVTVQGTETGVLSSVAWRAGDVLIPSSDGTNSLMPARLATNFDSSAVARLTPNVVAGQNCAINSRCQVFLRYND